MQKKSTPRRAFLLHQQVRLTGIAIVAASKCIAGAISGSTAWGTVAAAILVLPAEAPLLAARLTCTLTATLPAKTLTTANTQRMRNIYPGTGMTLSGVAVGLAVPLTMTFFRVPGQKFFGASGMAMTAVRRAVVKTIAGFAGETTRTVAAEAGVVATTETTTAAAARAAVAARTIRSRATGAQFVLGLQSFDGVHLDALLGVAFDALQQLHIAIRGERDGNAGRTRATGTTDAVHVVFGEFGQVEVDHMRNAAHVETARRHIGGDQDAYVAVAHVEQGTVAFALVHVTVQCRDRKALCGQFIGQCISIALGGGEHQCLIHVNVGQQMAEHLVLVRHVIGKHHALFDVLLFVLVGRNGNTLWFLEPVSY